MEFSKTWQYVMGFNLRAEITVIAYYTILSIKHLDGRFEKKSSKPWVFWRNYG